MHTFRLSSQLCAYACLLVNRQRGISGILVHCGMCLVAKCAFLTNPEAGQIRSLCYINTEMDGKQTATWFSSRFHGRSDCESETTSLCRSVINKLYNFKIIILLSAHNDRYSAHHMCSELFIFLRIGNFFPITYIESKY